MSAISWREQVNFQWDDNEVHFVLDQHAYTVEFVKITVMIFITLGLCREREQRETDTETDRERERER